MKHLGSKNLKTGKFLTIQKSAGIKAKQGASFSQGDIFFLWEHTKVNFVSCWFYYCENSADLPLVMELKKQ